MKLVYAVHIFGVEDAPISDWRIHPEDLTVAV
jgi:hypothetical protein